VSTSGGGLTDSRLVGTVLEGRYRVGAMIARGGMSTVYRGMDLRLDRPVAIKVMKPSFAADPTFLTRFEREARLAAGLTHRGVVAVYDQGRDDDVVFLVMELVDGGTLRDLIRQSGALSVSVTMSILEPLLSALGAAHAAGLVHRDVKPENVLISSKGEVKVADFGLMRAIASQSLASGELILGTVAYLSPEQVATGAADARSDVYAAGIVAFEMLTGRPPYAGDNAIAVAYQHVHADIPPVTDQAPGVPVELDDLILAATRRDPMSRPRDASAFLSALVSTRARLGLARAVVPVPLPGPGLVSVAARTTAGPVGPSGTRVVAGARPATAPLPASASLPASAPRRRSAFRRWLIVIIIVVLLGAAAAVGGWWLGSGRWAYIPPAVGVEQQSAEALLRNAGLVPHVSTEPNNTLPSGTVAGTEPVPGSRLLKGSDVEMVVSTGRPVVPRIEPGTSPPEAVRMVTGAHLVADFDAVADRYDSSIPAGAVVTTDPAGGTTLAVSTQVLIVRSKGPEPLPVPPVAGKSAEDARNKLSVAGFTAAADERVFDQDADDGTVLGSDPAEGREVSAGSPVALVVATSRTVPAVRGEPSSLAVSDLQRSGFTVTSTQTAFDADVDGGSALGTTPAAGTKVDPANASVVLTLSDAVLVPDVTEGDVGSARQQLSDLGLRIEVSAMFGASGASVIDQLPGAGRRVEPGSTVLVSAFP